MLAIENAKLIVAHLHEPRRRYEGQDVPELVPSSKCSIELYFIKPLERASSGRYVFQGLQAIVA